ncbi:site-2 protease family protein [Dehalococcoidia bacterium]|nr:site-2 protease family protein [Dehalococcoidia bacterium]
MLLGSIDLLLSDPLVFLRVFPVILVMVGAALLVCITVHECSHALASYYLGDLTAKRLGRLSLNPIRHLDPIGTALLVLVGFGWGKPVPVNPDILRKGRYGMALVAAAGPIANITTAFFFSIPFKIEILNWHYPFLLVSPLRYGIEGLVSHIFVLIIYFNIVLAVFNLLPIFPLDGSNIAKGILPPVFIGKFGQAAKYMTPLLLLVVAFDIITSSGIVMGFIGPVVNYVGNIIVGREFF